MKRSIRLSVVPIAMLAFLVGCRHEEPVQTERGALEQDKAMLPTLPTIAATPEYSPTAHGTTERKVTVTAFGTLLRLTCSTPASRSSS